MAAHVGTAQTSRPRTMVIPREHGAWGMLLVPLATGAAVGAHSTVHLGALILFVVAAVSLFWLRTPVESWLGTSPIKAQTKGERGFVLRTILSISAVSVTSVVVLLWMGNRQLLLLGALAAGAFALQALVKTAGRNGRMPAQMIGAIGLTSTVAGAYYVASGHLDRMALALWLANWLFAVDQIHFVQLRIHTSRAATLDEKLKKGLPFLLLQISLIGVVLVACRFALLPAASAVAFLPVLARGTYWFIRGRQPLDVHRLGFAELAHSIAFGVLLCGSLLF